MRLDNHDWCVSRGILNSVGDRDGAVLQPAVSHERVSADSEHPVRKKAALCQEFTHGKRIEKALIVRREEERPEACKYLHAFVHELRAARIDDIVSGRPDDALPASNHAMHSALSPSRSRAFATTTALQKDATSVSLIFGSTSLYSLARDDVAVGNDGEPTAALPRSQSSVSIPPLIISSSTRALLASSAADEMAAGSAVSAFQP